MRDRLAALAAFAARHADASIAVLAFLAVAVVAAWLPAWQALERKVFDELTVHTASGEAKQPIVLVAINEEAMNALKLQWPWPRTVHADLVERVARGGAAVIALDIVFYEPARDPAERGRRVRAWERAVRAALAWASEGG